MIWVFKKKEVELIFSYLISKLYKNNVCGVDRGVRVIFVVLFWWLIFFVICFLFFLIWGYNDVLYWIVFLLLIYWNNCIKRVENKLILFVFLYYSCKVFNILIICICFLLSLKKIIYFYKLILYYMWIMINV